MIGRLGWFGRGTYGGQAPRVTTQAREERAWRKEAEEEMAFDEDDDLRPCKGKNSNICVAEGCFNDCLSPVVLKWRLRKFIEKYGDDNITLIE